MILKVSTIKSTKCYLIVYPTINLISLHILHLIISAPAVTLCPIIGLYFAGIETISVARDREHMCTSACWEKRCASLSYLLNNACRLSPQQMFYLPGTLWQINNTAIYSSALCLSVVAHVSVFMRDRFRKSEVKVWLFYWIVSMGFSDSITPTILTN